MRSIEIGLVGLGLAIGLIVLVDTAPSLAPRRGRKRKWRQDVPSLPRERQQLLASTLASILMSSVLFHLLN